MSKRTTPPSSLESRSRNDHRVPEDDLRELISGLRDGTINDDADDEEVDAAPVTRRASTEHRVATPAVPQAVLDVLDSPARNELVEVAKMLSASVNQKQHIIFHLDVGDIRCDISWLSQDPSTLLRSDRMFFVKMRSDSRMFTPKPGAVFDVGFHGMAGRLTVICLSEPQRLYPGVDLLCFMPHNPAVEKNGKLNDDAPSVVSGEPSNEVVDGEPVVKGEKPAQAPTQDFDFVRG